MKRSGKLSAQKCEQSILKKIIEYIGTFIMVGLVLAYGVLEMSLWYDEKKFPPWYVSGCFLVAMLMSIFVIIGMIRRIVIFLMKQSYKNSNEEN